MSTSAEMYTARINTPVHISLSSISHTPNSIRLTSYDTSATSSRLESRGATMIEPTFSSSARHGSLTLIVLPPVSTELADRLCVLNGNQTSTSQVDDRGRWAAENLVLQADRRPGIPVSSERLSVRRRRDAPAPPRLPDYAEMEPPPPPYNPDFLAPTSHRRWSDVFGRRPSSMSARCPPPPPPSRRSSSTAEMGPRSSLPLITESCVMVPPVTTDDDDDDDDVFFAEKPATLEHAPEVCR